MRKTFTVNGKRYEVCGRTQHELDEKYFQKRLEIESKASKCEYTVSEWGEIWFERYKKPAVTKDNYHHDVRRVRNHIFPQIGDLKLSEVTFGDCQDTINKCGDFSNSYIRKIAFLLKNIFKMAVAEKLITESPAKDITLPKGNKISKRRSLTSSEMDAAKKAIRKNAHGLYFALMLYCGLRPYECGFIQGKDIVGDKLHVRGTKTSSSDRWVFIPDVLVIPNLEDEEYLFPHLTEQKRRRWWNSFKKDLEKFGCAELAPDLVPYCFRHTFCTNLEEAGVPINIARQFMGHQSIRITTEVYTHTTSNAWNMAAARINCFHSEDEKTRKVGDF